MKSTVDARGRILIPRAMREKFHLTPGSIVDIGELEGGMQIIADRRRAAVAQLEKLFEIASKTTRREGVPPFDPRETKKIWEPRP